jgi:hypothetical protein
VRARVIVALVVVLVALAFVALTLRLFVYPDLNAPQRSDAIVVLGGDGVGPFEGRGIGQGGLPPTIVLSLVPAYSCQPSVLHLPSEHIVCFRANPQTTQDEARAIAHLAAVSHWHRVIVVMPTRRRPGRAYAGQVLEVGVAPAGFWAWMREFAYEWGALVKALVLQRGC